MASCADAVHLIASEPVKQKVRQIILAGGVGNILILREPGASTHIVSTFDLICDWLKTETRHWPIILSLPFFQLFPHPRWTEDNTLFHFSGLGLHIRTSLPRQPAKEESHDLLLLAVCRLGISINPGPWLTNKTYTQIHPSINVFQPLILFVAVFKGALIQRAIRAFPPIRLIPINVLSPHSIQPDKGEVSEWQGGHISRFISLFMKGVFKTATRILLLDIFSDPQLF